MLQVDNPCAVLDQENSKKFLQGSESDKYAFFMKATDLDRIHAVSGSNIIGYSMTYRFKLSIEVRTSGSCCVSWKLPAVWNFMFSHIFAGCKSVGT